MSQNILIIDDERNIRRTLDMILSGEGYQVFTSASAQASFDILQKERIHLILLDIVMPEINGLDLLPKLLEVRPDLAVIMISGHGNVQNAVLAIKRGAYDFLEKTARPRQSAHGDFSRPPDAGTHRGKPPTQATN